MPGHHPESPARLDAIQHALEAAGVSARLQSASAPAADPAQLERVHAAAYLDELRNCSPAQGCYALDPDTVMNTRTLDAALHAAGAGILGVDRIMQEYARRVFCAVRPPGHHAGPARAMGFCFLNNVAVAAAHALEQYGLERVAVLDFDVHHGNGTQDIFRDDMRVLFCSIHQHPFYPYTGDPVDAPNTLNTPLAAGCGSSAFRQAVERQWIPALEEFKPRFLFVSAGFDAHRDDPLGGLDLSEDDYAWVGKRIAAVADLLCQGRVLSCLEGGYSLDALGRSAAAYIGALGEQE